MQQINYGNNNNEREALIAQALKQYQSQGQAPQQEGGQASPEDLIKQRIQQALLKQHTSAKPPTLESIGKGFEKNIGEGVAQTANYLMNSPRGQKITGALMASQNPEMGKMMYQSGTALESDYRQQAQQAQQRNQQQVGLGMQYLRDEQAKRKADAAAKVDAEKAANAEIAAAEKAKVDAEKLDRDIKKEERAVVKEERARTVYTKIYDEKSGKLKKSKTPSMTFTADDAKKIKVINKEIAPIVDTIDEIIKLRKEVGQENPLSSHRASARQLATKVRAAYKNIYGLGVLSDSDIEMFIDPAFPEDPLGPFTTSKMIKKLELAKKMIVDGVKNANAEGLMPTEEIETETNTVKEGRKTIQEMSTEELLEQL